MRPPLGRPNQRLGLLSVFFALCTVVAGNGLTASAEDSEVIFAVVTQVPPDRRQIHAHVTATGGQPEERSLLPSDRVLENRIWKKLEKCQALRADASKTPNGYRLVSITLLDARMLPMSLQGLAGDCLLKRALEFAPQLD